MADYEREFQWISETEQDFQPLFKRMDRDADMYNQIEYALMDLETNRPSKDVVNITMNDPKVFADRAQAFMNDASMQTVVEGRHMSDKDTSLIENFDADIRYEIDSRLMARDISSHYSFNIEQACIRGTLGARYISWDKDGEFIPDMLPADSRYLIYEYGDKDLDRVAFKTIRSKASILAKYPRSNFLGTSKTGGIQEEWTKDLCRIWLVDPYKPVSEGQMLKESENIFGYVPFVVQGVGAGSMLQDEKSREHRFESIFANNRLLYEHLNMLGSILQTLNYFAFNRPDLWESDSGTLAKKPPTSRSRKTLAIDKGTRGLMPSAFKDIGQATRLFYSLLLGAIQRGSLPNIDYGNLTFPLSAVAISKLTSQKDAIFSPRLQAIALFNRKLHYMIRNQYVDGGYEAELGEEGLERTYKPADLDKKYKIAYNFHSVSPEQDIANYAVAQQALAIGMSRESVYTKIIKLQDPMGEIMKSRAERAEQLDPVIAMFRYGHALIDQGTEESFLEADLVAMKIENLLNQPVVEPEPQKPQVQGRSLVPLMEGGGGRGTPMDEDEGWASAPEEMMRKEERRGEVVRKSEAEG